MLAASSEMLGGHVNFLILNDGRLVTNFKDAD